MRDRSHGAPSTKSATLVLAALTAALAASPAPPRLEASAAPRPSDAISVWEGAYTEEQAERGQAVFRRSCLSCHVPSTFRERAFLRAWSGRSAYDLFELMRRTMPTDNPGRLSRTQYADVVAYVLRLSGFPAGSREMPSDDEELKRIRIENKAKAE